MLWISLASSDGTVSAWLCFPQCPGGWTMSDLEWSGHWGTWMYPSSPQGSHLWLMCSRFCFLPKSTSISFCWRWGGNCLSNTTGSGTSLPLGRISLLLWNRPTTTVSSANLMMLLVSELATQLCWATQPWVRPVLRVREDEVCLPPEVSLSGSSGSTCRGLSFSPRLLRRPSRQWWTARSSTYSLALAIY